MRSNLSRSRAALQNPRQSRGLASEPGCRADRGFTLVEMLVAMAITLVMMAAVVTLFANVTNGVRNRRATLELSAQMRQVRNTLQQDLQGATCPGQTWQKPESNHGYIEYIEGPYRDGNATNLVDADPTDPSNITPPQTASNPEIDHQTSTLPSSNLLAKDSPWATDGSGLGDYDDILMLTVRNESKPFVGRAPSNIRLNRNTAEKFNVDTSTAGWDSENIESQLAEVVWFSIENPGYTDDVLTDPTAANFFGEPGYRTVYRRTLLIAPWVNPYRYVDPSNGNVVDTFTYDNQSFKAEPGLVRMLPSNITLELAIAGLVAFQDRYDLSVRLEWDASLNRFKIMANTLGDLTKRENRFCHYGYSVAGGGSNPGRRVFPYPMASWGGGYSGGSADVEFVPDPEVGKTGPAAKATAQISSGAALSYSIEPADYIDSARKYKVRPFAFVNKSANVPATAQAMLNDEGGVVRVLHGPVPLWGERHGEDVQLTNVLAFDVRAFDPGAPIFRHLPTDTTLTPNDPGWKTAYESNDNMRSNKSQIGWNNSDRNVVYPFVGQGAYVNLGYGYDMLAPNFDSQFLSSSAPWFFAPAMETDVARILGRRVQDGGAIRDVYGRALATGYAVYDTWSFHYENDGIDEDADGVVDQGTEGLDSIGRYLNPTPPATPPYTVDDRRLGVDDIGERETAPPYDKPLRGAQVIIRAYERDSRVIRQMRVNQHFMPE